MSKRILLSAIAALITIPAGLWYVATGAEPALGWVAVIGGILMAAAAGTAAWKAKHGPHPRKH